LSLFCGIFAACFCIGGGGCGTSVGRRRRGAGSSVSGGDERVAEPTGSL